MKIKQIVMLWLILLLPLPAKADLDMGDIINWLKNIYNVELNNLPGINQNTKDTVTQLKNQTTVLMDNLNGHHGFGQLLNDVNARQWTADSWLDTLQGAGGENAQKFKEAQATYERLYPVKKSDDIGKGLPKDSLTQTHYEQSSHISRAALAASQVNFDSINDHIRKVNNLLQKLESDDAKTQKGALDLNTRLVAELSFIQLDMLKMQSIQTQLSATDTQAAVNGLSDQATFLNMK